MRNCRSLGRSAHRGRTFTAIAHPAVVPRPARQPGLVAASAATFRDPESFAQLVESTNPPAVDSSSPTTASTSAHIDEVEEVLLLVRLLPPRVRQRLEYDSRLPSLIEVVMDLGRPPLARFPEGDVKLSSEVVSDEDLKEACDACGQFGGDNRAGIDGTLHRISAIRSRSGRVVGLTCRAGRAIQGSAAAIRDLATSGKSILLLGRPGVGKTTVIRELARLLADECRRRVVIVDTSNEIGGDGDIPHPGIGAARRMQVPHPDQQHRVMIEAVENHMPEVIIIDEIGTEAESLASRTIAQRGVQLIATAHGNELENVMKNPSLNDLVGGISSVTLGDDEAKRRGVQKSILERSSPPTFDVAVEMGSRDRWKVHLDVAAAVDELLLGGDAGAEVRERDAEGKVWAWPENGKMESGEMIVGEDGELFISPQQGKKDELLGLNKVLETQPFPEAALAGARGQASPSLSQQSESAASKKRKAKSAAAGVADAPPLQFFAYGVAPEDILSVAAALDQQNRVGIAGSVQEADVILATRAKLRDSAWVKSASQAAGIPLFTVKSGQVEHVVKGVRTLLGMDPTPGSVLFSEKRGGAAAVPGSDAAQRSAAAAAAPSAAVVKSGMDEAREAIEEIVLAKHQPVELSPRPEAVVERQVALAQGYGLRCEVAGVAATGGRRVRVLPMDWMDSSSAAPKVEEKKKYW